MSTVLQRIRKSFKNVSGLNQKSIEILNSVDNLADIIITIEKRFIYNNIDFKYDSKKKKFIRLNTFEDKNRYLDNFKGCDTCSAQCFKSELSTKQFILLVSKSTFKPVAIRKA